MDGNRTGALWTRRGLLASLSAGAAPLVVVACGGGGAPATETAPPRPGALGGKVQVAYRTDPLTIEMYGGMTDEFRKQNPGAQVEFVDIGGNYDTPLLALFAAGTPPDAFWLRLTSFASYLSKRLLLNIEPYSRRDARAVQLEDFFPGILDQGRVRGGLYGLPADGGGPVLFYNVEQFDRAGVPTPGVQQDGGQVDGRRLPGRRQAPDQARARVRGVGRAGPPVPQQRLAGLGVGLGRGLPDQGRAAGGARPGAGDRRPAVAAGPHHPARGDPDLGRARAAQGPRAERPAGDVPRRAGVDDLGLDDDRRGRAACGRRRGRGCAGTRPCSRRGSRASSPSPSSTSWPSPGRAARRSWPGSGPPSRPAGKGRCGAAWPGRLSPTAARSPPARSTCAPCRRPSPSRWPGWANAPGRTPWWWRTCSCSRS